MQRPDQPCTTPSKADGDGVRIIRRNSPGGQSRRWVFLLMLALAVGAGGVYLFVPQQVQTASADAVVKETNTGPATALAATPQHRTTALPRAVYRAVPMALEQDSPGDNTLPSVDPDDLASYISPGDPVPTMTDVISTLHEFGIHEGLGAFNPPGTSPPLQGLAVPENFELPQGYVRHHQVSDDGEPIEAILMFSPDFEFYDESGNLVDIPADRVVPPELAPPGLPIVQVQIPSP